MLNVTVINQWKGARVLGQTNTRGRIYNSFFWYTKLAERSPCHVMLIA